MANSSNNEYKEAHTVIGCLFILAVLAVIVLIVSGAIYLLKH